MASLVFWTFGTALPQAADDCSASPTSVVDLDTLLPPAQATAAEEMPFGRGSLFKISRAGIPPSFVFGTLHLADGRLVARAEDRAPMVRDARTVVLELKPEGAGGFGATSGKERRDLARAARPKRSRQLRALLRPPEIERLKQALVRRSLSPRLAETVSPAALIFLLDQPSCERQGPARSMDQVISEVAQRAGKDVVGLETIQEQLAAFEALTPEEARDALLAALEQADVAGLLQDVSIRLYLARKGGVLLTWTRRPHLLPSLTGPAMPARFLDQLITLRNGRMEERLKPLLARGGVFVAVGILHLPGDKGVLNRLAQDGYTVERLD